jgi:Tol biopolymer transport system component
MTRRLVLAVFLAVVTSACQWTAVVSVDSAGQRREGLEPSVSADGRFVVFHSWEALVSDDGNSMPDIYRRDLREGTTERVSVDMGGGDPNGGSSGAVISGDGRFVAFSSQATDLLPGDTNGKPDIYVRDMQSGEFTGMTVNNGGARDAVTVHSMSADGNEVAFTMTVFAPPTPFSDIYVADRSLGTTTNVGIPGSGLESTPALSADGSFVAFLHAADEFPSNADNVYLRNLATGTLENVSIDRNGVPARAWSPSVSADAHYVAFVSDASNLVAGDTNGQADVFVRDMQSNTTARASLDVNGQNPNERSFSADISDEGRYVAFHSAASDLVPGDTNDTSDVFVRDRVAGTTTRASVDPFDGQTLISAEQPKITGDGTVVVFQAGEQRPGSTYAVYARAAQRPAVTGVAPSLVPRGGKSVLTITGAAFRPGTRVFLTVAGTNAFIVLVGVRVESVTVLDEHTLQVVIDVALAAPPAIGNVWVVTPAPGVGMFGMGGSVASLAGGLTIT